MGGNKPVKVDIRLIGATNRNLDEMVADGRFREDLLYRINTIHLHLPPLRERREDIAHLADMFLKRFALQYGRDVVTMDAAAVAKLTAHSWPGNIRELEHVIEKAVILSDGPVVTESHFSFPIQKKRVLSEENEVRTLEEMERMMIEKALGECSGNMSAVAAKLGITRQTLYNKMKKYGL